MSDAEKLQIALNELMAINQMITQRCINLAIDKQTLQQIISAKEKAEELKEK